MQFTFLLFFIILISGCGTTPDEMVETIDEPIQTTYETIIFDTFDINDQTIWQSADWANGDPFLNAWCPQQIDFNNSILSLSLDQTTCSSKVDVSGEYRTFNTYMYGRYTAKFIASDKNGTISSFFTYTGLSEGTEWDEIDIEILGKDPTKIQFNYWRNGNEHPIIFDLGFDASKEMHIYSFVWHQDYIQWYVDNTLLYSVSENNLSNNDSLPINPGKIIINLWAATGIDNWSGSYQFIAKTITKYDYIKYEAFQ